MVSLLAWEWCEDWYDTDYYKASPVDDPPGPCETSFRVSRGGCWNSDAWACRSAYRFIIEPEYRINFLGFRVALTPPGQ